MITWIYDWPVLQYQNIAKNLAKGRFAQNSKMGLIFMNMSLCCFCCQYGTGICRFFCIEIYPSLEIIVTVNLKCIWFVDIIFRCYCLVLAIITLLYYICTFVETFLGISYIWFTWIPSHILSHVHINWNENTEGYFLFI